MHPVLLVFVAIALFLSVGWHRGRQRNQALILNTVGVMETVFQPRDTTYTNIGGFIGYNVAYTLDPPLTRLEGTIITLPRHAVLYLPLSRYLFKREDMLLITLYGGTLKSGRGYIVEAERYHRGTIPLDDREGTSETPVEYPDRSFVVLWYNPLVRDRLKELLDKFSPEARNGIRYIGYYGSEGHMAYTVNPNHSHLETVLREIRTAALPNT